MRQVRVDCLSPGMKIAKNIFDINGRLLISEGTIIKPHFIRKLELYSINSVFIKDEILSEETMDSFSSKADILYDESFKVMKNVMSKVKNSKEIDMPVITDVVEEIVDTISINDSVFKQLSSISSIDDYTYYHSLDVCVYSIIMGKKLGFARNDLIKLGIGALLHDVGKALIPEEILLKPEPLTEKEFGIMKNHTILGYEVINDSYGSCEITSKIALQHHEHWDGTGYPYGIKNYNIHLYSRIVMICDIYDALTADRVYRERILPHEAAEYIVNNESVTDPHLSKIFIKNIALYPVGMNVVLNDGEIGKVIEINNSMPLRPKIEIYSHTNPEIEINPYILDLMDNLTIFITDVIK